VLNLALGALPGVFGAGEVHWIFDKGVGCRECGGEGCPILTPRILRRLIQSGPECAWEVLAEAGEVQVVVSSDKNPAYFDQMGHPDVVLYVHKKPQAHVASRMARTSEGVRKATAWYANHSLRRLKWVNDTGKPAYSVYLPLLGENPSGVMQSLARLVGRQVPAECVRFWECEQHYVGGNFSIEQRKKFGTFDMSLRRGQTDGTLTEEEGSIVALDAGVAEVSDRLSELRHLPT
jgi:hypothetical protein